MGRKYPHLSLPEFPLCCPIFRVLLRDAFSLPIFFSPSRETRPDPTSWDAFHLLIFLKTVQSAIHVRPCGLDNVLFSPVLSPRSPPVKCIISGF